MKTRTLLLLALACGAAIMAAGAVFLIQLSNQKEADAPVAVGDTVDVGDMRIVVDESVEASGVLDVTITIGGVDDVDGTDGFRLIAAGRAARPQSAGVDEACGETTVAEQRCVLRFDVSSADGDSRVLFYERGDERARWVLA
jgi:hypothetical protein